MLNVKDLKFPMPLTDISNFEKMNNLSINEYGLTETKKVQIKKITDKHKNLWAAHWPFLFEFRRKFT